MSEWIEWHGGECPVPKYQTVTVKLRGWGEKEYTRPAYKLYWGQNGWRSEIIAYRIHETPEQRLDRLERELAEARKECADRKESEQWEPEGGRYGISSQGRIASVCGTKESRKFGTERPTRELAEKARDAMRIHNRALAYVHEHAPDGDKWNFHSVIYDMEKGKYIAISHVNAVGGVKGPEKVMQKLADDLNSGRVKL